MLLWLSVLLLAVVPASFARHYARSHSTSRRGTVGFHQRPAVRVPLQKSQHIVRRGTFNTFLQDKGEGLVEIDSLVSHRTYRKVLVVSDASDWLPFRPLPGSNPVSSNFRSNVIVLPSKGKDMAPISLGDIDSIACLVESDGKIIKGVSDVPSTIGISSFDLFAGNVRLELGFFVDLELGTPSQTFRVQLDTSSADTFVSGEQCASCAPTHGRLGISSSSSFVRAKENRWITPVTYTANFLFSGVSDFTNVSGVSINDTISLAGLKLPTMAFGVATDVQNEYTVDWLPFDGVMGIANSQIFPPLSLQKIASPIVQLADADLVPRAQVGIYVGRSNRAGQFAVGGVDPTIFKGQMTVVKSISRLGYWEAPCDIQFAGRAASSFTGRSAVFDTRSASILAPQADIDALGLTADAFGHILLPCNGAGLIMTLVFAGQPFSIPPSDLILLPLTDTGCRSPPCCLSALQVAPARLGLSSTQWVVGTAALKSIYLGLSFEDFTIGLASVP